MARLARNIIFDGNRCFHIIVQGIAKSYVFESDKLKGFYIKCLAEKMRKYEIKLLAFCVMSNHAHFLICGGENSNISLAMKEANITYANYYNKICKRVGYVFRDRFRSEPITGVGYLLDCIAYIHNNPVKAGIVEIAEEYQFSSAKNYLTQTGIIDYITLQELIGCAPIPREESQHFMDDEYDGKKEIEEVVNQIYEKYLINEDSLKDDELLFVVASEIYKQAKISIRKLAEVIKVNRERLRKVMSKLPSP